MIGEERFGGPKKLFEAEDEIPVSGRDGGDRQAIAGFEQR